VRKLAFVALLAVSTLGACKKTGEGEYKVETPDVDVSADTHTVQTPSVDVGTKSDTMVVKTPTVDVNTPAERAKKDTTKKP